LRNLSVTHSEDHAEDLVDTQDLGFIVEDLAVAHMKDLVMVRVEGLMGFIDHVEDSACHLDLVQDVDTIEIMSFLNIFNDTIVL